jgi:hypothetical protein
LLGDAGGEQTEQDKRDHNRRPESNKLYRPFEKLAKGSGSEPRDRF